MAKEQYDSASSTRWWEFYAVRYGMGTVIGSAILLFLQHVPNGPLCALLPDLQAGHITGPQLTLLAAYGFAYCYIASAPILVLHAGRFCLDVDVRFSVWIKRLSVMASVPAILAIVCWTVVQTSYWEIRILCSGVVLIFVLIVWSQLLLVYRTYQKKSDVWRTYTRLAGKRHHAVGDIVNSYRHLREHGNSFLIVVFEIVLGVILYCAGNCLSAVDRSEVYATQMALTYISIILIWVIPACFVWLIGMVLERKFIGF